MRAGRTRRALDSLYVVIDGGDGILVTRTDLDGDPIWTHLYGDFRDQKPMLVESSDGNHIIVAHIDINEGAVISKIDAIDGTVVWSQSYSQVEKVSTLTRRGSNYVLMGEWVNLYPSGFWLSKPIAISVADADGSVNWAKKYHEDLAPNDEEWTFETTEYAVNTGEIAYVGKYYSVADLNGDGNRKVFMMKMNPNNGIINLMHNYDFEVNANDYAIDPDANFPWDIARLKDTAGNEIGFAIAGTYSHSDTAMFTATDPIVLRVDQNGAPLWTQLYGTIESSKGFARGLRQNDFFMGDRLDVYTTWEQYNSSTVTGMMRIDASDGTSLGMSVYDVPNADFEGLSMNTDGFGGYLALGRRSVAPFNAFELLKVGQVGGGVACLLADDLEPEDVETERVVVEIVYDVVVVEPDDHALPFVEPELEMSECDTYAAAQLLTCEAPRGACGR